MQRTVEKNFITFCDQIRSAIHSDDYITATILINEVKKALKEQEDLETPDQVYLTLLEVVDKIQIQNPFRDKDSFFLLYREGKKLNHIDWEGAIAKMMSLSRNPVLPVPLIMNLTKRFKKKMQTVLIAEAEKFVPNLQHIIDENINTKFVLTSQNPSFVKVFQNVFDGYENVEILLTDIYQYQFTNMRFDFILSCPNFGGRTLAEDTNFMCREFDMVALENLLFHLNSGGELEIVLPGRITFASGRVNDLRQFIQQNYSLREIAELPEGTLEFTGIKVYLFAIENSRPQEDDDIMIRRYTAGEKKNRRSAITTLNIEEDTFVMLGELEEQGDWSISKIFAQQNEEYLNYQNSSVRKELIGNIAQVFRGKAISKKEPTGNISIVNISNIREYDVDYEGLEHLEAEERKVANYMLQEGDVLLPARGTALRTAVFEQQIFPCIASANLIIIRPDKKVLDSTYLKIFLDSPIGNQLINGAQQGMNVMNISYKDLNVLEIPLPTMEEQQAVVKEYTEELKKYKETIAAAQERWNQVLERLQKF